MAVWRGGVPVSAPESEWKSKSLERERIFVGTGGLQSAQYIPQKDAGLGDSLLCSLQGQPLSAPAVPGRSELSARAVAVQAHRIEPSYTSDRTEQSSAQAHRMLDIRRGTLKLCAHYGEGRGKCNNAECDALHICRAWLAGYLALLIYYFGLLSNYILI